MIAFRVPSRRRAALVFALAALAGCAVDAPLRAPAPAPRADVRAIVADALPPRLADRAGWAADIDAALSALGIEPGLGNVCAVIAITEQESGFRVDPPVPNLARIAWQEIDRRAERLGLPRRVVRGALQLESPDGRRYAERIDAAKTEHELSRIFDDFIGIVPLGRRLFGGLNPVRTGGPMQVSVAFAERHVRAGRYPYAMAGSIRDEVFTRRGGVHFGVAHLLDYAAPYDRLVYRFADYNAGRYASRNAAFQHAVGVAAGIALALDGDLVRPGGAAEAPGSTELAVRSLGPRLGLDERAIRRALEQGDGAAFEQTALYRRVFDLAERRAGRALPRAVLPRIALQGPKIQRPLTTAWFARRVDERHRRCLERAGA